MLLQDGGLDGLASPTGDIGESVAHYPYRERRDWLGEVEAIRRCG
jgi:hypothetical protein